MVKTVHTLPRTAIGEAQSRGAPAVAVSSSPICTDEVLCRLFCGWCVAILRGGSFLMRLIGFAAANTS